MSDRLILTASSGMPADDNRNSLFAGLRGPASMREWLMIYKWAHH